MHAEPHSFEHARAFAMPGEHDDRNVGPRELSGRAHVPHELGAVHAPHFPVEHHDVGRKRANRVEAAQAVDDEFYTRKVVRTLLLSSLASCTLSTPTATRGGWPDRGRP